MPAATASSGWNRPGWRGTSCRLVWRGSGRYDGHQVAAADFRRDELLVCHGRATSPIVVENTGRDNLLIIKFFGPDINLDVPMIPRYGNWPGPGK